MTYFNSNVHSKFSKDLVESQTMVLCNTKELFIGIVCVKQFILKFSLFKKENLIVL